MAKEFSRIVVPTDGSDESKKAAKKAISLAKYLGVDVMTLYVIDTSFLARVPYPEEIVSFNWDAFLKKGAHNALDKVEKMGKKMGVTVVKKMVEGIPDEEIIKEAKKNDLIVMGSKGRTALDRIMLGSVSEKVVHHASCPVLIVRETKKKASKA